MPLEVRFNILRFTCAECIVSISLDISTETKSQLLAERNDEMRGEFD
jgi:hypothetical protein